MSPSPHPVFSLARSFHCFHIVPFSLLIFVSFLFFFLISQLPNLLRTHQMGKGRTTVGLTTACLIKEIQITKELKWVYLYT